MRLEVAIEYQAGNSRSMAAVRGMIVSAPSGIIGPGAPKAGCDEGVLGRHPSVKRTYDRRSVRRQQNSSSELCHPVMVGDAASAAIKEWFDGARGAADLGYRARDMSGKGGESPDRGMDENDRRVWKEQAVGVDVLSGDTTNCPPDAMRN